MARYVDAEKITRRIVYYYGHTNEGCGEHYAYSVALKEIDRTPTADVVEVKHGEWIEGKTLEKCSVCGKKGFPDWHYCPHCGAKMSGGGKNDL